MPSQLVIRNGRRRRWLAFALAPLTPSIFFLIALHPETVRVVVFMLVISISFSYVPCFVLGLPLLKFLDKRQSVSTITLTVGGALIGAAVFYVFGLLLSELLGSPRRIIPGMRELVSGALLGSLVAISFGLIAGFPLLRPGTR
jgi:hypothetical protein